MTQSAPVLIHLENVHKSFSTKTVLCGVDLDIHRGESFVVIGQSGSGKSVLLKCLLGLLRVDQGQLMMDGVPIQGETRKDQEKRLRNIGMVFQGSALFDSLSVWENVAFGLIQAQGKSKKEAKAMAFEKLSAVGLSQEVGTLYPAEISGGMQRRVALARAIALSPRFLFFDEPTAGLDPIFSALISQLIRRCVKELGATSLTITHDLKSAHTLGDRIAMLHEGRIIWQGPLAELSKTDNPVVRQFVEGQTEGPICFER